jgi:hypothetical protein
LLAVVEEAWENSWNSLPICSGVMPMPVSGDRERDPIAAVFLSLVSGDGDAVNLLPLRA